PNRHRPGCYRYELRSLTARAVCGLTLERAVHLEEGLLLAVVQGGVTGDGLLEPLGAHTLLEDPGPDVEALGRDAQGLRDLLEDVGARLSQPALDLAQVRVRDPGERAQVPQRQAGAPALLPDERAQVAEPLLEGVGHGGFRPGRPCDARSARPRCGRSPRTWPGGGPTRPARSRAAVRGGSAAPRRRASGGWRASRRRRSRRARRAGARRGRVRG